MNPIFLILSIVLSVIFSIPILLPLNFLIKSDRLFQIVGIALWIALIPLCYLLVETIASDLAWLF